jgi:hypothetical protein
MRKLLATGFSLLLTTPAPAACPVELATYGERDGVASVEFQPTGDNAVVTNTFRMLIGEFVPEGIVMWSDGEGRPNGMITHNCPIGDVTGAELVACTLWQGIVYTSDGTGGIGLLPAEGSDAPLRLIFTDLGPALHKSLVFGPQGLPKPPWDVFEQKGCQE